MLQNFTKPLHNFPDVSERTRNWLNYFRAKSPYCSRHRAAWCYCACNRKEINSYKHKMLFTPQGFYFNIHKVYFSLALGKFNLVLGWELSRDGVTTITVNPFQFQPVSSLLLSSADWLFIWFTIGFVEFDFDFLTWLLCSANIFCYWAVFDFLLYAAAYHSIHYQLLVKDHRSENLVKLCVEEFNLVSFTL